MGITRAIKGGTIVAFQGGAHRILKDGIVVYRNGEIVHVGASWDGKPNEVIDATGMLVCPGFISVHCHAISHPGDRVVVDGGRRDFLRSGFINYVATRLAGGPGFSSVEDWDASHRFGFATLLKNGVTTVVQLDGGPLDEGATVTRIAGESGMRVYYSPVYNGGDYFFDAAGTLVCQRDEAAGLAGLRRAAAYIERRDGAFAGRLRGIFVLDELFNATPRLLSETKAAAKSLGVKATLHASEQLFEFHEILRRTGRTPVGWMEQVGFLDENVILGHCVYVSGHPLTGYPFAGDLEALRQSGAFVAHAPVALSRRGVALQSFQRFLDAGIGLAIGTDSYPHDIIAEMRAASIVGKLVDANNESASARDVFNAATLGGAAALGRSDLGRIAIGAKADFTIVDMNELTVGPMLDPIKALIHAGGGHLVDTVIVGGEVLVKARRLKVWDEHQILAEVRAGSDRVWSSFGDYHWSGRPIDEVFPQSFVPWRDPREEHVR